MSNFKIGDVVYCTKGDWTNDKGVSYFNPPKVGEEVAVLGVRVYKGHQLLQLSGQPKNVFYPAKHFDRPSYLLFNATERSLTQIAANV